MTRVSITAEGFVAIYRIFDKEPEMVNNPSAVRACAHFVWQQQRPRSPGTTNASSFYEIKDERRLLNEEPTLFNVWNACGGGFFDNRAADVCPWRTWRR